MSKSIRWQKTDGVWSSWFYIDSITNNAFKQRVLDAKDIKAIHIEELMTKEQYESKYGKTLPSL